MKLLENCAFCIDYPNYAKFTKGIEPERIIEETNNFRVIATLGQILGGYIVIAPREHYACIGAMPEDMVKELAFLKDDYDKRITKKYSKPVHWEHGVIGQTVLHAHMHLIPFPEGKDLFARFRKDFPEYKELSSLLELKDIWKEKGVYVYYEDRNNKKHAFFTNAFPMYARYVSAEELGVPEKGNWRNVPRDLDWILIRETVKNLKEQKRTVYNKLVRDKIPEVILQKGKTPVIHTANDQEYWQKLKEKLNEEVDEFLKNSTEEELVDIFEVIYAIADFKKIDKGKLELLRKKKSEERGGFKKKIILEETK